MLIRAEVLNVKDVLRRDKQLLKATRVTGAFNARVLIGAVEKRVIAPKGLEVTTAIAILHTDSQTAQVVQKTAAVTEQNIVGSGHKVDSRSY